ncbi:MAG TPA: DUF6526 family protein [Thermoanaerobaculia bacterium]|nr:DUF6526 family protein [Thermoanaerobaculia bacterium]
MARTPQTYENHARYVPLFHFGLFGILLVNFVYAAIQLVKAFTAGNVVAALMAVAYFLIFFFMRTFATTVQDRIIRLEVQLRLERILPADLKPRIRELSRPQLIALRFAGDGEMAGLVREVLEKNLQRRGEIKKKIRDWQADHFRV